MHELQNLNVYQIHEIQNNVMNQNYQQMRNQEYEQIRQHGQRKDGVLSQHGL